MKKSVVFVKGGGKPEHVESMRIVKKNKRSVVDDQNKPKKIVGAFSSNLKIRMLNSSTGQVRLALWFNPACLFPNKKLFKKERGIHYEKN